jgi:hypothetical protein
MQMLSMLGKVLKDDDIIELLDRYDVEVIYSFDRLHENSPDNYLALIKPAGVELRFNELQVLETIFCYIAPREGFDAVSPEAIGAPAFGSFELAKGSCLQDGIKYEVSANPGAWLKVHRPGYKTHYAFENGRLSMITLTVSHGNEA